MGLFDDILHGTSWRTNKNVSDDVKGFIGIKYIRQIEEQNKNIATAEEERRKRAYQYTTSTSNGGGQNGGFSPFKTLLGE
jgi:hypothetical protein